MSYPKGCQGKSSEEIYNMIQNRELNEIDGRDGAPLIALEQKYNCHAYSLSIQDATTYDATRHIAESFCSRQCSKNKLWGKDCA
eukprot:scaffold39482_cov37-Cyclotella_meneghiniana.AAC.1